MALYGCFLLSFPFFFARRQINRFRRPGPLQRRSPGRAGARPLSNPRAEAPAFDRSAGKRRWTSTLTLATCHRTYTCHHHHQRHHFSIAASRPHFSFLRVRFVPCPLDHFHVCDRSSACSHTSEGLRSRFRLPSSQREPKCHRQLPPISHLGLTLAFGSALSLRSTALQLSTPHGMIPFTDKSHQFAVLRQSASPMALSTPSSPVLFANLGFELPGRSPTSLPTLSFPFIVALVLSATHHSAHDTTQLSTSSRCPALRPARLDWRCGFGTVFRTRHHPHGSSPRKMLSVLQK